METPKFGKYPEFSPKTRLKCEHRAVLLVDSPQTTLYHENILGYFLTYIPPTPRVFQKKEKLKESAKK